MQGVNFSKELEKVGLLENLPVEDEVLVGYGCELGGCFLGTRLVVFEL